MGSGAAATRSVAQIVLLNDDFATLPHVVAEGAASSSHRTGCELLLDQDDVLDRAGLLVAIWRLPFPSYRCTSPFIAVHHRHSWPDPGVGTEHRAGASGLPEARDDLSIPAGVVVGVTAFVAYLINLASVPQWSRGAGEHSDRHRGDDSPAVG